jgi:hypothetical protein
MSSSFLAHASGYEAKSDDSSNCLISDSLFALGQMVFGKCDIRTHRDLEAFQYPRNQSRQSFASAGCDL